MLVPSFWKHPLSENCQHFRTPLSRAFPALETPLNTEKCSMYPPKFEIISQESKETREKKKNTPFLKKSPGEKSNTPLFLQFSGRTLSHEKYPFTGHFGNTHAVIPTAEWGAGGWPNYVYRLLWSEVMSVVYPEFVTNPFTVTVWLFNARFGLCSISEAVKFQKERLKMFPKADSPITEMIFIQDI